MIEFAKIVAFCIAAAVCYGVVHDQFTIRICLEYFTVGHVPRFQSLPTTAHAAAWGIVATWWVGLTLGILVGLSSRLGRWPKRTVKDLIRPIGYVLIVMAIGSAIAGFVGYIGHTQGLLAVPERFASRLPDSIEAQFMACGAAHFVAYRIAALGGLWICIRTLYLRRKAAQHI